MTKEISKDQLAYLQSHLQRMAKIKEDIATMQIEKQVAVQTYLSVVSSFDELKKTLQSEYGDVNIDANTGIITPLQDGVDKKD